MCIIMIKPKGVDFPSTKIIRTMFENNPDGFSIVYSEGGEAPKVHRTMCEEAAIRIYETIKTRCDAEDTNLFIHARIATHGTIKISNCHGWRDAKTGIVFAHNGVLDIKAKDDWTDSETFFRQIFIPVYRNGGWKFANEAINAFIGTSKFVFMDRFGNLYYSGTYNKCDGVMYSNYSYMDYSLSSKHIGKWDYVGNDYDYDYGYGYNYDYNYDFDKIKY